MLYHTNKKTSILPVKEEYMNQLFILVQLVLSSFSLNTDIQILDVKPKEDHSIYKKIE